MPLSISTLNPSLTQPTSQTNASQSTSSLVIVDAAVNHYQHFLTHAHQGMKVHKLNAQEDGISQLLTFLPQYQHLSNMHLICEGAPGQMQLGTTLLSEANLWAYADDMRRWRNYLTRDAEISIYGCDLAANRVGQAFVSWLGLLTGACIHVLSCSL